MSARVCDTSARGLARGHATPFVLPPVHATHEHASPRALEIADAMGAAANETNNVTGFFDRFFSSAHKLQLRLDRTHPIPGGACLREISALHRTTLSRARSARCEDAAQDKKI